MDNYNLDTGKKYIKDIFAKDCFYSIPEYQRPYVWGRDQIVNLLDDIHATFDRDEKKEYFIGCMIWNTRKEIASNIDFKCQDILDGQQRFISLYLLHGVFRDLSTEPRMKAKVAERLRQEADVYDKIPARNRIVFEIRKDHDFLDEYLLKEGGTLREQELLDIADDVDRSNSIRRMAMAVLTMHSWFKEEAAGMEPEKFQGFLDRFFSYLSNQVLALYLATPDNLDDAYNLFTVLNSRGLQLQVSDILVAQNLRTIEDERIRKTYAERWEQFQNAIDAPFNSFDEFLWALVFIKMKYRSDDNKSLQKAFDFMFDRGVLERGPGTFDFVGKYAQHFEKLATGSVSVPVESGKTFQNLNFLLCTLYGSQYMGPLMHYRELYGDHGLTEFIIKLDNLLSATWLVGKRSGQIRNFIILRKMEEVYKSVLEKGGDRQQAADEFLSSDCLRYDYKDENANTFLNIEELFEALDQEKWGGYAGTRINKTRYILLKLDFILSGINTQLQFEKSNSSLEHLMPQKLSDQWNIIPEEHKQWVHRLGNIVLIDGKKNSSLSNRPYKEKKELYIGTMESRAHTNTVLIRNQSWSIDSITANHQRIMDLLRSYYTGNSFGTLMAIKKANSKITSPAQQQLL